VDSDQQVVNKELSLLANPDKGPSGLMGVPGIPGKVLIRGY
jgi:hypothetical protein